MGRVKFQDVSMLERSPGEEAFSNVETSTDSLAEGRVKEQKAVGKVYRHGERGAVEGDSIFMGVKPASDMELGALFFLDSEEIWREHFLWTP